MPRIYPTEFRQRAIKDTATKLGIPANTLTRWCNHATLYTGKEITTETEATAEIRRLKRENAELRRVNEILKTASA